MNGFQFNPMAPSFVPANPMEMTCLVQQPAEALEREQMLQEELYAGKVQSEKTKAQPVPPRAHAEDDLQAAGSIRRTSSPQSPRVCLSDFDIICPIGDGMVGRVYLVRYSGDAQTYAMKVASKGELVQSDMLEHIQAERLIQSHVRR